MVSRPAFARAAHGIRPPGGVYCHVSGCDLVRDDDGAWKVLEDNVRTPCGISYVLENRRAMTRLLPGLFEHYRVRPVDHYPALLRTALEEVAPTGGEEEATVVVWTPGPFNSAYFEHAFLARQMGVELVEASDLVVRDAVCHIRTTRGLQRVHAIYRRIDDDFMDPLEFRPDSVLGVPGLMRAYRAGSVAIVNAVGTGVADDKAIYHYVPEMIRYYLGEEPLLENVQDLPDVRPRAARVRSSSGSTQVVVKPTSESGGKGVFIGPTRERARSWPARRRRSSACRRSWIAQELVHLSTVPTAGPGRHARAAPRRPAPVRGLRRGHPHRAGRAHPRRAARGLDDRQLVARAAAPRTRGCSRRTPRPRREPAPLQQWSAAADARASRSAAPGPPSSNSSSNSPMLARIAHELYWIGRQLARAEHTSRMLDGVFHADLQGRPDDPAGVRLSWDALLTIVSGEPPETSASRDEVLRLLTLDPEHPTSVLNCISRAREGARTVRDVFSGEMWEAINTFHLGLLQRNISAAVQTGPYSVYAYVRERCGLFWGVTGRTMLRDEAHAFLQAGAAIESADMVLRMLRVALPADGAEAEAHLLDGQALALLQAVGGFQAYRRSVPAPPNARPVARFLLFERDYPDSVAFSIEALHAALTAADPSYRSSPAVLRLSRLMADLDFRARTPVVDGTLADDARGRPGRARPRRFRHRRPVLWQPGAARRAPCRRMNFAIRYLTEYRYSGPVTDNLNALRVKPATLADPERRGLRRARGPRVAPEPAPRLLRDDRDRVRDLAPARAPLDRRPRAGATRPRRTCRRRRTGARSRTAPTTPRRASSCCSTAPSPTTWRSTTSSA